MGMSSPFGQQDDPLVNDINMTPFIDVMLVLLIVFMITLPVVNRSVKVDLPKASTEKMVSPPKSIDVSVTADGKLYWDKEALSDEDFLARLSAKVSTSPQPDIHLFADEKVEYSRVAFVITHAHELGFDKIDFVMQAK